MPAYILYGLAYLVGSIPFGLVLTKMAGKEDIRHTGSGNIGATNVLRSGSKGLAFLTLCADLIKGALPVLLAKNLQYDASVQLGAGMLAILGHIFPLWLRFKGGKGVATGLGVYLALCPLVGGLVILTWAVAAKIGRISSLSALLAFFLAPFYTIMVGGKTNLIIFSMAVYFIVMWTHRDNIKRLLTGEEKKF